MPLSFRRPAPTLVLVDRAKTVLRRIDERLDTDPAFYGLLRTRVKQIIADRAAGHIEPREEHAMLDAICIEFEWRSHTASALGLSETTLGIHTLLCMPRTGFVPVGRVEPQTTLDRRWLELARLLEELLAPYAGGVGYADPAALERTMRVHAARVLYAAGLEPERIEATAAKVVELLLREAAAYPPVG